jgi:hypothetical protein
MKQFAVSKQREIINNNGILYDEVLVGKPEGKRPLGRPRRRWEDGI